MRYEEFYRQSIDEPEQFWAEQARLIHWDTPPRQILDQSNPPFRRWFVGGTTNLCYNAVDRHLAERAEQLALVAVSSETDITREFTYRQLHREVNAFAAVLQSLGVGKGDRVVIYLPNIAEAVFAMLACARIGAIHSVVFGGFAAHNLALRIDDAQPKLLIAADAGMRSGKVIPYKPLVDAALNEASSPPPHVLIVDRKLDPQMIRVAGRDLDYAELRTQHEDAEVPVTWLESNEPSYLLYTSGTTGKPKGVQRDVGGYAVAMALSIRHVFDIAPGQVMFATSDVGWAVGHSYNVYGPLIGGATSLLYEGLPTSHPLRLDRVARRYAEPQLRARKVSHRARRRREPRQQGWLDAALSRNRQSQPGGRRLPDADPRHGRHGVHQAPARRGRRSQRAHDREHGDPHRLHESVAQRGRRDGLPAGLAVRRRGADEVAARAWRRSAYQHRARRHAARRGCRNRLGRGHHKEWSPGQTVEAVKMLIDLGIDPNAQADTGRVALHGAAHKGATEVVKILVAAGARMDIRDFGNTDNRGSPELAAHTWLPIDYADGLVRVGVQSAIPHPETAKVLRDLMKKAGLEAPPEGRTLETICIVEVCSPDYDPNKEN